MGKGGIFPLGGELWGKKGGTISKCVVRRTHACLTFLIKAGEFGKLAESDTKRSWSLDKNLPSSMSRLLYWRNLLTANCRYSKRVYWKFQRISRRVHWLFSTFPLSGSVECVIPSLPRWIPIRGWTDWLPCTRGKRERAPLYPSAQLWEEKAFRRSGLQQSARERETKSYASRL